MSLDNNLIMQAVPPTALLLQEGKREAGEVPARSRHCNCGALYNMSLSDREGCTA